MLKKLTQIMGVAGYEKEVREFIVKEVEPYADSLSVDALGNLTVFLPGKGADCKKIMLAAHMDEIGYQVTKIESDGRLRVCQLGWLWTAASYNMRVVFRNGAVGVVSCDGEIEEARQKTNKLFIDIGCKTKEEALKLVNIGDVCCYFSPYAELANGHICSKALDDRIGCYQMIELIRRGKDRYNDCYYVFTVQEELGCRGSTVAAERIQPDIGIAVDITPAHDYPCDLQGSNEVGGGAAIKISDPSVICDEYLVAEMIACCGEHDIRFQRDVIDKGGTDAGSINRAFQGVRSCAVSVVTRYPHSPNSVISRADVDAAIELLHHFTDRQFSF